MDASRRNLFTGIDRAFNQSVVTLIYECAVDMRSGPTICGQYDEGRQSPACFALKLCTSQSYPKIFGQKSDVIVLISRFLFISFLRVAVLLEPCSSIPRTAACPSPSRVTLLPLLNSSWTAPVLLQNCLRSLSVPLSEPR